MNRFTDYFKWPERALIERAEHHVRTIARLRAGGYPHGANKLVLAEIFRVLDQKGNPHVSS